MNVPTIRVAPPDEVSARHAEFAAFERAFTYPLGADRFHIDHGADYLAFFRALGSPEVFVAEDDGGIAGVLVAVRRRLLGRDAWYLCDLKAHRGARALLRSFAEARIDADTAAYGVSMNANDGSNRLAAAARRCAAAAPLRIEHIAFFTFDHTTWQRSEALLTAAVGPIGFLDNHGRKDIVLASTGRPMPLLHAQHGPLARPAGPSRAGAVHMLGLAAAHRLVTSLRARGIAPMATASVLLRNMDRFDPSSILTSDI